MGKLHGKIAVITGGSSGIGLATAKAFVDEGAYVFIAGRRQEELAKAAAEIGREVTTVRADVAELPDLDRLWDVVREKKGAVDVIVANAGFVEFALPADVTPEHFERTFNTNARGTFFTVQKGLPLLRDGGSIVLIGSSGHVLGVPIYTTYLATKAAIRSFTRSWAADLKDRKIRVNSLSPGPVDTPIFEAQAGSKQAADTLRAAMADRVPLGRLGRSEEIATTAVFLASDDSSFITGHDLLADGGQTAI
ncbi:SDR family NAD(P)-dependent oxidoreductase [Phytohabitans suffuscus]|uniref:Oxidoreductase n=1 Tax=Phytohabitans suffuscus TaxID=624315 RepID=A0A6F8YEN1_9ACTN|nr:glucose 1-dehydrogenase [Phytohabitans suffuscus]BCB84594.1 oxidoreductase [Phytohabitans suffuscus]